MPPPNTGIPVLSPTPDPVTPDRDITHRHFQPREEVLVLKGIARGRLWGRSMRVVTPSWHTPTDKDGWRLRDPNGGRQTYITAHPGYLAHATGHCPDCLIYLHAMEEHSLPEGPHGADPVDCGWYTTTALGQLVHVADTRGGQ
ncbi:hypothetical protein FM076_30130 [Streptomyces albus subsp. chlorinus]|nr:hypothetical protein [Streptomyces albus]NSC25187.1 hypothetical protein [Streptomyces albus subsp. chlorinus]